MKDFISLVIEKQEQFGLTDKEVSEISGIPECIFYDLKKYRTYLTRLSYYSICAVMGITLLELEGIEELLQENKSIVGVPDTNLKLAAQVANPEYVRKLEKEVTALQKLKDRMDSSHELISMLRNENIELKGIIEKSEIDSVEKEKENYQNMSRESIKNRVDRAIDVSLEREYREKIEFLNSCITKRDKEITKLETLYYSIFMDVNKLNCLNLFDYPIPKLATNEEKREITDSRVS